MIDIYMLCAFILSIFGKLKLCLQQIVLIYCFSIASYLNPIGQKSEAHKHKNKRNMTENNKVNKCC